jgi:uncharacterized protein (DUF58 family)
VTTRIDEDVRLVTESELEEIELIVLRRLREYTLGEHRSLFHGPGFDYVGTRTWEAGDRLAAVDWPQSSLTNFSPLVVRDFEQRGTAAVVAVADRSRSTRCGTDGMPVAQSIAWAIGTLGMSAALFQDAFGLMTFDRGFEGMETVAARVGRAQVMHCLDAYQESRTLTPVARVEHVGHSIAGAMRRTSLVAVISDFLFDDLDVVLKELAYLNATHDVFLVIVDAADAFDLPAASASWVRVQDVETGRHQVLSCRAVRRLAAQARAWQDEVAANAKDCDLEVVRIGVNRAEAVSALSTFTAERRVRKR